MVQDALRTSSEECANAVKVGTSQIDTLLLHMVGQRSIDDKFKLCDKIERSIDNPLDVSNFYLSLSDNFAGVVQYNHDNRASTLKLNLTVEKLCSIMTDKSLGNEINRLAAVNSLLLQTSNETCLDYKYDNMLDELRNTSWDAEASEGGSFFTHFLSL